MQLEVDIEPTLRFPGMISIDKEMDQSESEVHQVQLTEPQPAAVYGIWIFNIDLEHGGN